MSLKQSDKGNTAVMNGQHFLIEAFHLNGYLTDGGLN